MLYLGIDQHAKQLTVSLRNHLGEVILIQPEKKSKVKTDRRDANSLSELLWVNRQQFKNGLPVKGVRQVVVPDRIHAENQRITLLRQQAGQSNSSPGKNRFLRFSLKSVHSAIL